MSDQKTVGAALRWGGEVLRAAGIPDPQRDARRLMSWALEMPGDRLTLVMPDVINPHSVTRFNTAIERRSHFEPVSHITGLREFWGQQLIVSADVLDPRPETEILIAAAKEVGASRILDLGTGSGAILLSLLAEMPDATGLGTDVSDAALTIATENAQRLTLSQRAEFCNSDWFEAVTGRFDLIVSNPPYIALDEMRGVSPDLSFEPRLALTDEGDGLSAYRAILSRVRDFLTPNGRVFVEIGSGQGSDVKSLFSDAGLSDVSIRQDFDGRDRVVSGTMAE